MKIQIYCAEEINKNFEYNQRQTEIGSPLKTYKGSRIARSSKYGVGKEIGGEIYFHKKYLKDIVPREVWITARDSLEDNLIDFDYNCIKYDPKRQRISYQEVPDFDTAREPVVGDWIAVQVFDDLNPENCKITRGHSNYIFHSKWLWVKNDYKGFDVAESWNWSKKWLSTLKETSDGNGIDRWNAQLDKYGLPHDEGGNN